MNDLCKILPSKSTLSILLEETLAETLLVVRQKSRNCKTLVSGDAANKKKTHHMIKHVSFCYLPDENLTTCELDSDGCVGADEKTAIAIDSSLKIIEPRTTNTLKARLVAFLLMLAEAEHGMV